MLLVFGHLGFECEYFVFSANIQRILLCHNAIHNCNVIVEVANFLILVAQLLCLIVNYLLKLADSVKGFTFLSFQTQYLFLSLLQSVSYCAQLLL